MEASTAVCTVGRGGAAPRTRSSGGNLNRSVYGGAPGGYQGRQPVTSRVGSEYVAGQAKARQHRRIIGKEQHGDFSSHHKVYNPNSAIRMRALTYDSTDMNLGR